MVNLGPVNMETKPAEALEKVLRTPENAVVFDESKISAPFMTEPPQLSSQASDELLTLARRAASWRL